MPRWEETRTADDVTPQHSSFVAPVSPITLTSVIYPGKGTARSPYHVWRNRAEKLSTRSCQAPDEAHGPSLSAL